MKHNSSEWSKLFEEYFYISDREGWGRNLHYAWFEERIDVNEFIIRAMASTCYYKKDWSEIETYTKQIKERYEC